MEQQNLLQNRVNELNNAIINFKESKVYIVGFENIKTMNSFLNKGTKNYSSMGMYDFENIVFSRIKNNALFIVQKDDVTHSKYQYTPIKKYTGTLITPLCLDDQKKLKTETLIVRKNKFSEDYQLINDRFVLHFDSMEALNLYLNSNYKELVNNS